VHIAVLALAIFISIRAHPLYFRPWTVHSYSVKILETLKTFGWKQWLIAFAFLLVIGFTGGIGLARTNLVLIKGASVLGVRAGEAVRKNPALGEVRLKALLGWAEAGKIRPHISHRLPLEDYAQAMRLLVDRKAIGRVALVMR